MWFLPFTQNILDNPYLEIHDISKLFVADDPMILFVLIVPQSKSLIDERLSSMLRIRIRPLENTDPT